jgi:glycosyltransferase involved in cell wall biosynthesis
MRDTPLGSDRLLVGRRVLFVLCGFDLGGAERQALHFARYLAELGCDVRVWGHHLHQPGPEMVIDHCDAAGIPWAVYRFRWPCRKAALVRDAWRMLRGLRRERPDVILPYTTWPNVGCGLTWRWSPARVCVWGQRDIRLRGDVVERLAYRNASVVICNAAHEIDHLRRVLGETRAPVHVVHNGIELAPAQRSRAEWRADLGIDTAAPVATMVANFRPGKDHATLLRAWGQVLAGSSDCGSRPRLLLAGAHQESYAATQQLAGDLGLLDSVNFLGQVKDVAGLLRASDIGILATADEGLPNAILEYMASGLPVIATDLPGNREALGEATERSFYMPGDAGSLAARLEALLYAPDLRKQMGARNRQRTSTEFSITKMCETMASIVADHLDATPTTLKGTCG